MVRPSSMGGLNGETPMLPLGEFFSSLQEFGEISDGFFNDPWTSAFQTYCQLRAYWALVYVTGCKIDKQQNALRIAFFPQHGYYKSWFIVVGLSHILLLH